MHRRCRRKLIVALAWLAILGPAWRTVALAQTDAAAPPSSADLVREFEMRVSPFDVGDRAQLFVDRVLVHDTERVWFTQHQGTKHPANPLIKADQPWEGWRVYIFGNVIYDEQEKLFKMWYGQDEGQESADQWQYFGDDHGGLTCYATSADGIRWQKPLVGTIPSSNGKPHNGVGRFYVANVMKDLRDSDASRRYKCIAMNYRWGSDLPPDGYHTYVSPDGLNWKNYSKTPIVPGGDVIGGFWDPRRQLYVAFPKQGQAWRGFSRRVFGMTTSRDFLHWSEPVLSWTTDLRDDAGALARIERVRSVLDSSDDPSLMRTEYYGIGVYPAESCTIGFPWMLTVNANTKWPGEGTHDGPQEIQLAVSRDLVNWERPFRTPVIGIGEADRWDVSYQMCAATAIRFGDEIRLYYSGANYTHGSRCFDAKSGEAERRRRGQTSSIGLVAWKLDRFVSADGPAEGGTLITVPVKFRGKRLEINAAAKQGGCVVVDICDAAGKPLTGYASSDPFAGDDVRHVVAFGGKTDVSALAGKPIVLRLHLKNAQFYSFAFRD